MVKQSIILVGILLGIISTAAFATTITQTHVFDLGPVDTSPNGYSYTYGGVQSLTNQKAITANIDKFDASLGTLNGVLVNYSSSASLAYSAHAQDTSSYDRRYKRLFPAPGTEGDWYRWKDVEVSGSYTMSAEISLPNTTFFASNQASESLQCVDSDEVLEDGYYVGDPPNRYWVYYAPSVSCSEHRQRNYSWNGTIEPTSFDLTAFIGVDPLEFEISNTTTSTVSCFTENDTEKCRGQAVGQFWGSFSVTYDYTEHSVPAPATWLIFAVSLLGLRHLHVQEFRGRRNEPG